MRSDIRYGWHVRDLAALGIVKNDSGMVEQEPGGAVEFHLGLLIACQS